MVELCLRAFMCLSVSALTVCVFLRVYITLPVCVRVWTNVIVYYGCFYQPCVSCSHSIMSLEKCLPAIQTTHIKYRLIHRFVHACTTHTVFLTLDERECGTVCCIRAAVLQQHTLIWRKITPAYDFPTVCHILPLSHSLVSSYCPSSLIVQHAPFDYDTYHSQQWLKVGPMCSGAVLHGQIRGEIWGTHTTLSHKAAAAAAPWRHSVGIVSSEASVNRSTGPLYCSCSCWLTLYITSEGETLFLPPTCFPSSSLSKVIHKGVGVGRIREGDNPPEAASLNNCGQTRALQ